MGDDAWCQEEFEEEEEDEQEEKDDEEEEGDEEEEDSEDEENADEVDEEEDSPEEEQEEDEPAPPSRKPVHAARAACPERAKGPAPACRRQRGSNQNAIVADLDGNAIARHLLEVFDFGPPPPK